MIDYSAIVLCVADIIKNAFPVALIFRYNCKAFKFMF